MTRLNLIVPGYGWLSHGRSQQLMGSCPKTSQSSHSILNDGSLSWTNWENSENSQVCVCVVGGVSLQEMGLIGELGSQRDGETPRDMQPGKGQRENRRWRCYRAGSQDPVSGTKTTAGAAEQKLCPPERAV